MNCKQDDLAIVVSSGPNTVDSIGQIVTCTESTVHPRTGDASWIVKPPIKCGGRTFEGISDKHLRPIRPSEGQDETLSWADVPRGVTA